MRSAAGFRIVLVTTPDRKTARALARAALTARVAACANLIPGIESHYWWKEKLEKSQEILVMFKTATARLAALEKLVLKLHPYDTAEFLVLPLSAGTPRYLRWIQSSLCAGHKPGTP